MTSVGSPFSSTRLLAALLVTEKSYLTPSKLLIGFCQVKSLLLDIAENRIARLRFSTLSQLKRLNKFIVRVLKPRTVRLHTRVR